MPGGGDRIHLNVKGQDGEQVVFRVNMSSRLKKLMNSYAKQKALDADKFVFLFDGRRINGEQTPKELEMEEGDTISAMLHQSGGGRLLL